MAEVMLAAQSAYSCAERGGGEVKGEETSVAPEKAKPGRESWSAAAEAAPTVPETGTEGRPRFAGAGSVWMNVREGWGRRRIRMWSLFQLERWW